MQLIRCTRKLQKEMGLKPADLVDDEPRGSCLGSWHANLLYIDRKKCVLVANDKTLFNFLMPDLNRTQIRALDQLFCSFLERVLASEAISDDIATKILAEYQSIGYAHTNSKSVLGSMNDLAAHYKYHVVSAGGLHRCDLAAIIKRLNRMPMGALEYGHASDALKTLYGIER